MTIGSQTQWGKATPKGMAHCFRPMGYRPGWATELHVSLCGNVNTYVSNLIPPHAEERRCKCCENMAAKHIKPPVATPEPAFLAASSADAGDDATD